MSQLDIQRVQKDAAGDVLGITQDAAAWLKEKGIDQWQDYFLPKGRETILRRFEEGEVFLGYVDGAAVATITLQWSDGFWEDLGKDPDSGYIHTMALRRALAGRRLGAGLLDWAAAYFKNAGRSKMRLDCAEENQRLCRFYDEHGFRTIGRKDWEGTLVVMKERILT